MTILLYFIFDDSPQQERTRKLVDGTLPPLVRLVSRVKSPLLKPVRGSFFALFGDARTIVLGRFHKRAGVGPSVDKRVGVPHRKYQRCDLQIQS
jgi:hypothetical protein